jgi:hypothetical protein
LILFTQVADLLIKNAPMAKYYLYCVSGLLTGIGVVFPSTVLNVKWRVISRDPIKET